MPRLKTTFEELGKLRNVTVTNEYVQFYDTKIAKFRVGWQGVRKMVEFDSGGYRSQTTKRHINSICTILGLNARLIQEQGVWYWNIKDKGFATYNRKVLFVDSCFLSIFPPEPVVEVPTSKRVLPIMSRG